MLSTRPALLPSISEKTARFSVADFRCCFSVTSRSFMLPDNELRCDSVPVMLSPLASSRLLTVLSVRERSAVTCETFCLTKSSSEPAMSIRSRSRPERMVSPRSNQVVAVPKTISMALEPISPLLTILASESVGMRYERLMVNCSTTSSLREGSKVMADTVPIFTPLTMMGEAVCTPFTRS